MKPWWTRRCNLRNDSILDQIRQSPDVSIRAHAAAASKVRELPPADLGYFNYYSRPPELAMNQFKNTGPITSDGAADGKSTTKSFSLTILEQKKPKVIHDSCQQDSRCGYHNSYSRPPNLVWKFKTPRLRLFLKGYGIRGLESLFL